MPGPPDVRDRGNVLFPASAPRAARDGPPGAAGTVAAEAWAEWHPSAPYSLGVEEEVMLLDAGGERLAQRADVIAALSAPLSARTSAETHQGVLELATHPHATVAEAMGELAALRAVLAGELAALDIVPAAAGTHPTAVWQETLVSPSERHQLIDRTMGELARREPTFALHVHVGVADAEDAVLLLNRLRAHLPLLLALSANSPFWQGRDSRLASARTPLFASFPRTGIPRAFDGFADWRATVDLLVRSGAIDEPTFLWWDVRLQPRYGTVELRIMDAQTTVADTASLCALVQSLARLELEEGHATAAMLAAQEALSENRFLAARDGVAAALVDADTASLRPVAAQVEALLPALRPHAEDLGCAADLDRVPGLLALPGAARQRALAAAGGVEAVSPGLAAAFTDGP
jgi:glutamate---cysteine ligase / carboxylate-amine ligase